MGDGLAAIRKTIEDAFSRARTEPAPQAIHAKKAATLRPLCERAAFLVRASVVAASRLQRNAVNDRDVHQICEPKETAEELFEEALRSLD